MADVGRPTIMTGEVLKKLDEIFALGGTDEEACLFADISPKTLYNYQEANPEYVQRKQALKQSPFLKARRTIVNSLDDPKNAQWYAERKLKAEFSQHSTTDITSGGKPIVIPGDVLSKHSQPDTSAE